MSKNVKLNDVNYNGISTVHIPTTDGGTATFKDVDEVVTPSGSKTISVNGTYDVTNFAQAVVNVATSGGGGGATVQTGTITVEEDSGYIKVTGLSFTPKAFSIVATKALQNSTCGATVVNGSGVVWRTGTNSTTVGQGAMSPTFNEMTVYPDDSVGEYTTTFTKSVKILKSGFLVGATNTNFPYRAGMELSWVAVG